MLKIRGFFVPLVGPRVGKKTRLRSLQLRFQSQANSNPGSICKVYKLSSGQDKTPLPADRLPPVSHLVNIPSQPPIPTSHPNLPSQPPIPTSHPLPHQASRPPRILRLLWILSTILASRPAIPILRAAQARDTGTPPAATATGIAAGGEPRRGGWFYGASSSAWVVVGGCGTF